MRILYTPNCYSQQRQREKKRLIYPVLLAMECEKRKQEGHEVFWNINPNTRFYNVVDTKSTCTLFATGFDKIISESEGLPFLTLPHPDRVFTRAKDYTSGNYKYLPGTHIMSASGCWHGKCSFCVEQGKSHEVRSPDDVRKELFECGWEGYKEVFDDAATFNSEDRNWWFEMNNAVGAVNRQFGMRFSCNYRMVDDDYALMKLNGFRMLLFGLESSNQYTLDRINKGVKVEDVKYIIKAAKEGLDCHIAVMFGYEWEGDSEAINTLKLVHYLLRKGYAKTAQASFYQAQGETSQEAHRKYIKRIYDVKYSPQFWFNQIKDIKNVDDLKYLWCKIKAGLER